ncbi:MAG: transposase [Cyclobacteriaceae bacterium]|nr:transposase [Cyclobacteriaceae bacterium]
MSSRRKFNKEFKEDAVKFYRTSGKTQKEVAEDLGISSNLIGRWNKEYDSEYSFPGEGNPRDKEIFELKKQVATLKEERDILKKAMAIFSDRKI